MFLENMHPHFNCDNPTSSGGDITQTVNVFCGGSDDANGNSSEDTLSNEEKKAVFDCFNSFITNLKEEQVETLLKQFSELLANRKYCDAEEAAANGIQEPGLYIASAESDSATPGTLQILCPDLTGNSKK
ncbi:MAG: hypothetical protein AAF738_08170 [Bacteroidota bacterium]